ncbi:diguanylate cyclase domain-containing protein [Methylophaga sp.]|uniref:diguanylate cyclase domain-containing protein n=1 Tax=Methylophaga sp. TaxID=2024840 RepID=UPI003A8D7A86
MTADYSHLTHIKRVDDLHLYELIPTVVWIFDLDRHGWWWGNDAALTFWGLNSVDELINKDLSGDTQGARDRMQQTFELAAKNGLSIDPWTTYPDGKAKTLYMLHRAVLIGPERHRAIIAYVNEQVELGETPENLLLVEAMRYTTVLVSTFTFAGDIVIENPATTEAYKHIIPQQLDSDKNAFTARFEHIEEGIERIKDATEKRVGRWTHMMKTSAGLRQHTLDIRITRHPLTAEFLMLVTEYDVSELHQALDAANQAQIELKKQAHFDAITGLPSLHYLQQHATDYLSKAKRHQQQIAVMFLDLDGFKSVNDTWGHNAGDQVLRNVAQRFSGLLRQADQLARIGGDEFVIMIDDLKDRTDVETVAQKLIDGLKLPIDFTASDNETRQVSIGVSIGIAFFPEHGTTLDNLLKVADSAMYDVKRQGKNNFSLAKPT